MDPIIRPPGTPSTGAELQGSPALACRAPSRAALGAGVALFGAVALAGVTWAKWLPYAAKLAKLMDSRAWSGKSILTTGGVGATSGPTWHGAWSFAVAYGEDIWMALVAAIVIAAAMEALIPRRYVAAALTRQSSLGGSAVACLAAVPAMMCTCCSAPLTVTLRRSGAPTTSALGFWLANPVLNPAVLAFLALVAPWQWVLTRAVVGAVLVLAVPLLAARLAGGAAGGRQLDEASRPPRGEGSDLGDAPRRFAVALGRLALTLVPEYFAVVLLVGAFRGWLMPLGASSTHWGVLALLVAAAAGALVVIPTAGEIPILLGLAAVGVSPMVLGALLITLPAISLPSMAMVGRALGWRVVATTAGLVAAFGLVSGAVLWVLG